MLIMDAKNLYDGVGRLLTLSPAKELPKPVIGGVGNSIPENGKVSAEENGVVSDVNEIESSSEDQKEQKSPVKTEESKEE